MKKTLKNTIIGGAISTVVVGAIVLYAMEKYTDIQTVVYDNAIKSLLNDVQNEETYTENIGSMIAIDVSDNVNIKKSLKNRNRAKTIKEINKIKQGYEDSTGLKSLKIHIHTQDVRAFVRSWKLEKHGDDLNSFRNTIVKVKNTKNPVFAFEVGRIGLTLRSIMPIIYKDDYIGSVEYIQSFESVTKKFNEKNNKYILLMNKSYLNIAKYRVGAPSMGEYVTASKSYDKVFFNDAKELNLDLLEKNGYITTDKYIYVSKVVLGTNSEQLGLHLMAMPIDKAESSISSKFKEPFLIASLLIVLYLILAGVILYLVNKRKDFKVSY